MAKSDTVHKCEVMDFFAYESEKHTNIKKTQTYAQTSMLTSKLGSDITLQLCFPDVIMHIIIYDRHKSTHQGFPQSQTTSVTDCEVLQKLQKGFFCLSALQDLKKLYECGIC